MTERYPNKRGMFRKGGKFRKAKMSDFGLGGFCPKCGHILQRWYDGKWDDPFPRPELFRYRCFHCEPETTKEKQAREKREKAEKSKFSFKKFFDIDGATKDTMNEWMRPNRIKVKDKKRKKPYENMSPLDNSNSTRTEMYRMPQQFFGGKLSSLWKDIHKKLVKQIAEQLTKRGHHKLAKEFIKAAKYRRGDESKIK